MTTQSIRTVTQKKKHWLTLNKTYAQQFREADCHKIAETLDACETTNVLCGCWKCGHYWYTLNHCRQRVCVLCSFRVARERQRFLMAMTQDMQHPKLITLTMKPWTGKPQDGIKKIRTAFSALRRAKLWKKVKGGAYIIEIVPHESYYHIHMHILLDAPFIPYQQLFSAWRICIKQHVPQVDVRSASSRAARAYIAKDASKNAVFYVEPTRIVDWYFATQGVRLFAAFGSWYHVKIADVCAARAWEKVKPVCPNCGASDSFFFARDGPWILGPEIWNEIWSPRLKGIPESIPLKITVISDLERNRRIA